MATTLMDLAPFIPGDAALTKSTLPDKAVQLVAQASRLTGQLAPLTRDTLERHMALINSYYSNLMEGNPTLPYEIRAAQRGDYSQDPARRDLQQESLAHIQVQQWLRELQPGIDTIFTPEFIAQIHKEFYSRLPESLWWVKDKHGNRLEQVVPGEWRQRGVSVGQHIPPDHQDLPELMKGFCQTYNPARYQGDRKLVAIMAAHHRFAYIHPFLDGNGRVGRLLTDVALKAIGLESYGVWCLSRGLARSATNYKSLLANADAVRQGNHDGRGALTEKGLLGFCDYMFDTAIDQAEYVSGLLELSGMRRRIDSYVQARNDGRVPGMSEPLKPSAVLVLYSAFIHGELERAQALELCAMPERSARRLLSQLRSEGLLGESSPKSPLRWEIPEHAEPWYFPQLAPTR